MKKLFALLAVIGVSVFAGWKSRDMATHEVPYSTGVNLDDFKPVCTYGERRLEGETTIPTCTEFVQNIKREQEIRDINATAKGLEEWHKDLDARIKAKSVREPMATEMATTSRQIEELRRELNNKTNTPPAPPPMVTCTTLNNITTCM